MNRYPITMMYIAAAAWMICVLTVMFFVTGIFENSSSADINRACVKHQGVQQVVDTTFLPAIKGHLTIVCKDGVVVSKGA